MHLVAALWETLHLVVQVDVPEGLVVELELELAFAAYGPTMGLGLEVELEGLVVELELASAALQGIDMELEQL